MRRKEAESFLAFLHRCRSSSSSPRLPGDPHFHWLKPGEEEEEEGGSQQPRTMVAGGLAGHSPTCFESCKLKMGPYFIIDAEVRPGRTSLLLSSILLPAATALFLNVRRGEGEATNGSAAASSIVRRRPGLLQAAPSSFQSYGRRGRNHDNVRWERRKKGRG